MICEKCKKDWYVTRICGTSVAIKSILTTLAYFDYPCSWFQWLEIRVLYIEEEINIFAYQNFYTNLWVTDLSILYIGETRYVQKRIL